MQAFISNRINIRMIKQFIYSFLLIIVFLEFVTCRKDEVATKEYPRLNTFDVAGINESGAIFKAEVISGNLSDIKEYGFVWDTGVNPNVELNDKIVISGPLSSKVFSETAHSALKKGVLYYMRAYLKTDKFLVYGKIVSFQSLGSEAPVITEFSPKSGTWNDTIKITGKNFRYKTSGIVVKLGSIPVTIISNTNETLSIVIPPKKNLQNVNISVDIDGNISESQSPFTYLTPQILEITPLLATYNETITIKGTNFLKDSVGNKVYFNGVLAPIIYISKSLMKVTVPFSLKQNQSKIKVTGPVEDVETGSIFSLKEMILKSFEPDTAFHPLEIITIKGENLNPQSVNDSVLINGFKAVVVEAASGFIKAQLPGEIIPETSISVFTNSGITVKIGEQSGSFKKNLEVYWKSKWTRKNNFPGNARHLGTGFSIGNKGYFGLGISTDSNYNLSQAFKDLWEYDPQSDTWTKKADFPGVPRVHASAFVLNDEGFIGLGSNPLAAYYPFSFLNDFYKYNPISDQWSRISDFPGNPRYSAASFVKDGLAFVGTGRIDSDNTVPWENSIIADDFWSYNPQNSVWTQVQNFPEKTQNAIGISIGNNGYVYDNSNVAEYSDNSWVVNASSPVYIASDQTFSIENTGYIWSSYMLLFDSTTKQTTKFPVPFYSVYCTGTTIFAINNKGYIVCGAYDNSPSQIVWEFDPSRP